MRYYDTEVYRDEEGAAIEDHIEAYFGTLDARIQEDDPQGVDVSVYIIEPTEERDFYTLVTCGMGAHVMNVPTDQEVLQDKKRAELVMCLPADWSLEDGGWAIEMMLGTAHFPSDQNAWLCEGHSIECGKHPDGAVEFSGLILTSTYVEEHEADYCILPNGEKVWFYQVIPLYYEEARVYSHTELERFAEECLVSIGFVADPDRENTCVMVETEPTEIQKLVFDDPDQIMDAAEWHYEKIEMKNLPLNEATGFNHLAIYLRWHMERGMMSEAFLKDFGAITELVQTRAKFRDLNIYTDLRGFLREEFEGLLHPAMFNEEGQQFAAWYYDDEQQEHYFPMDIDAHALAFFGKKRYYSDVFQDEAYLFVPWEEFYYQNLARRMNKRFRQWKAEYKRNGKLH